MPDTDRLSAELATIRERAAGPFYKFRDIDASQADVPRLIAALETALEALGRHQHAITDSRGTICAGCLSDWPCSTIAVITAALTGTEQPS